MGVIKPKSKGESPATSRARIPMKMPHAAGLQATTHGEVEGHGLESQPRRDLGGGGPFGVGGGREAE